MKRIRLFIIVLFSLVSLGFMEISATWQELQGSPNGSDITAIALSAENPARLYIGTKQALYATSNREDYQTLFHLPLSAGQVNFIYDSGKFINTVYAATEDGLYKGMRDGSNWVKMFSSSDENSRRCLSFTIAEGTLYLGTLNGLFYQKANSLYWEKIPSELSNRPIFYLSQDDKYVYAATDNELFRLDRQLQKIEKIFTARISKEATSAEDEGFIIIPHSINYLTVSDSLIVIATTEGIFVSNNSGDTWTTVPQNSIPLDVVTSLLPLTKFDTVRNFSILMGTQRGAYLLRDGRGTPLYKGMETSDIRYLVKDEGNTVYAATDKGVFSLPLEALLPGNYGRRNITTSVAAVSTKPVGNQDIKVLNDYVSLERQFDNEPNINEVHQWAIDYAEVSPDKIKDWRNLAGKKAIFPNVSVGVNRSGTELFH